MTLTDGSCSVRYLRVGVVKAGGFGQAGSAIVRYWGVGSKGGGTSLLVEVVCGAGTGTVWSTICEWGLQQG